MCPSLTMPTTTTPSQATAARVVDQRDLSLASSPVVDQRDFSLASAAAQLNLISGSPTAVIFDLDPTFGIRFAASLSNQRLAHVVLILPRWPHTEAILPTDTLVTTLVEFSKQLRGSPDARHVVFVLDGPRTRSIRRPATDPRVDNRYDLAVADLPTLQHLRAAGIQRIVKLGSA